MTQTADAVLQAADVELLTGGLVRIASGDFDFRVPRDESGSTVDVLAYLVNSMIDELAIYVGQSRETAEREQERLRVLVDERTAELRASNDELNQKNEDLRAALENLRRTQAQLIQSEKLAALGQLVASVAHELNTPLGAIRASVGNLSAATDAIGPLLDVLAVASPEQRREWVAFVRPKEAGIAPRTAREERAARREVARALEAEGVQDGEALAAILVDSGMAGGADELAQIAGLLGSAERESLFRGAQTVRILQRNGRNIHTAADRAAKIVFALKRYAHPGGRDGVRTLASLVENLDVVLTLYHNQIKHHIDLSLDYQDPGILLAHHEELNQVWTNLVHNALQAMESKGRLGVVVRRDGDEVVVAITDSGRGVPPELVDRIFDPFFTTKTAGEGSGLGLSISREIVARHGGRITVESQPGRTCFTVRLPHPPTEPSKDHE